MPNCNCDFDENNNQVQEEESIEDRFKNKILYGKELIYFTKKVQDEIASASSAAQSSEEIISAIESAKSEILADVRDIVDDSIDGVNSKLDLILEKLDELDERILSITPLKLDLNKDAYVGELSVFNLVDPVGNYFYDTEGHGISVENLDDMVVALRAGRTIEFSEGESGITVLTEDSTETYTPPISYATNGEYEYEVPDGLEVYEEFHNNGNDFFIFKNAVILGDYCVIPSEQEGVAEEMRNKMNDFISGRIQFEEYMNYFEPYMHTVIVCRFDGGVKGGQDGTFIFTDIPKEDFIDFHYETLD